MVKSTPQMAVGNITISDDTYFRKRKASHKSVRSSRKLKPACDGIGWTLLSVSVADRCVVINHAAKITLHTYLCMVAGVL